MVKAGQREGDGAAITGREGLVLRALSRRPNEVAFDADGDEGWLVGPWHDGPSIWEALRPLRQGDVAPDDRHVKLLTDTCRAVHELHQRGWAHGDLQPAHFIRTRAGVRLIDLAWACSPELAPSPLFRGGFVHLVAPELAAAVASGESPVAPTPEADVYSLAAGLWFALTGRPPLNYAAMGFDADCMTPAVLHGIIANHRIPLRTATTWPEMLDVLMLVLQADEPSHRMGADRLAELLESTAAEEKVAVTVV